MSEPKCGPCGHTLTEARPRECSVADCPHRRHGTSLWGPPALERRHDGTGWDRFYRGQRNPPNKEPKT